MEEILASIRKIISEDSPETHAAHSSPQEEGQSAQEPEVLELTQEAHDESATHANDSSAPVPESVQPVETLEHSSPPFVHDEPERDTSAGLALPSDGIFSEKSRRALEETFIRLDPQVARETVAGAPAPVNGLPIEALFERAVGEAFGPVLRQWLADNAATIVERMKPTIGEWMDEHFPAMLEDAVRAELARAIKLRGRR
jgi:hypothetical protein